MSGNNHQIFHGQIERTKLSQKVLYYFVKPNTPVRPTTAKCIPTNRLMRGLWKLEIRLSLKINISLTIGETYKMIEDFSTQSALPAHEIFGDYFQTSCIQLVLGS